VKILDILSAPWAIVPEKLIEIRNIYVARINGDGVDFSEIEKKIGKPLDNEQELTYPVINGVAIIPVQGVIAKRANYFQKVSGAASSDILSMMIGDAAENEAVNAIMLDIDSPGGAVDGTEGVSDQIYSARGRKPIVAFTDGMMASAAYWIGSAADEVIISGDTVQVGSIGVVATHIDISEAEKRAGIKTSEIVAGKYKRVVSSYRPLDKEGRADIQEKVDYIYSAFVDAVARRRGVTAEYVHERMADGRLFMGRQSVDAGLVDRVMSRDAVMEMLSTEAGRNTVGTIKVQKDPIEKSIDKTAKGDLRMDIKSVEDLRKAYPDVMAKVDEEVAAKIEEAVVLATEAGVKAGKDAGAEAERERIKSVEAECIPGAEKVIAGLKFDGKTTGPEAAQKVLGEVRRMQGAVHEAIVTESPAPVAQPGVDPTDGKGKTMEGATVEEQAKAEWEESAKIREEFGAFEYYEAFRVNEAKGLIKILKK